MTTIGPTFITDSFTDVSGTNLSAHVGELGATWAKNVAGSTGDVKISSGGSIYHAVGINGSFYYASGASGADYQVIATVAQLSAAPTGIADVLARCSTVADTRYGARYSSVAPTGWSLYKTVNGVAAALGAAFNETIAVGSMRSVILEVSGTSITLYVDGTSRISVADSAIALAGRAGISIATVAGAKADGTNGLALDSFTVKDLDSTSTATVVTITTTVTTTLTSIPAWVTPSAASSSWNAPSGASTPWSTLA